MALQFRKTAEPYYARTKPETAKKKSYLHWLHALPCAVTGKYGVEAAHVSFPAPWYGHTGRAKGKKAPDVFAVPLRPEEHALQHSGKLGSEEHFWKSRGIDPHQLATTLWAIYSSYPEPDATALATSRINSGLALANRLQSKELA